MVPFIETYNYYDSRESCNCFAFKGNDYYFLETVEDWLQCIICQELANEARITACCAKTLCWSCHQKCLINFNKKCPYCRQMGCKSTEDFRARQRIQTLMTYCPNMECQWKGFLKDVCTHTARDCQFEKVFCHQCKHARIQRRNMETHIKKNCMERPVSCPLCQLKEVVVKSRRKYASKPLAYSTLINEHYKTCPKWPMRCPNRCDPQLTFTRGSLRTHLGSDTECPEKMIDCSFAALGCKEKIKVPHVDDHIKHTKHLSMLLKGHFLLEESVRKLQNEKKELERNCKQHQSSLMEKQLQLKKQCSSLEEKHKQLERKLYLTFVSTFFVIAAAIILFYIINSYIVK